MGYYWKIINLDQKQRIDICKLGEDVDYNGKQIFEQVLGRRWKTIKEVLREDRISFERKVAFNHGILSLPLELLDTIFFHIEDVYTAFNFGCANTRLLIIGEKRIHQLMGKPDWTGDRIICVNESSTGENLPEGLTLDDDYTSFWDAALAGASDDDSDGFDGFDANIATWAEYRFSLPIWPIRSSKSLTKSFRHWWSTEYSVASSLEKPVCLTNAIDVLWNLSKKEYILARCIPEKRPQSAKKFYDSEILGTALLFMICWSEARCGASMGYENEERSLNRGRWAGDRFEITGEDVLELRTKEERSIWKDVSQEVFNLWTEVFEAE